jgi:predicted nucleic acid-binding protein
VGRLFLDANVPTYAAGRDHPLKEPCKVVLRLSARHPGSFFSDAEVIQEMLHRYLSLRQWSEGKRVVLDFATLMAGSVEPVTAGDTILACDLADRYAARPGARLAARDLLHAAVMLRAEDDAAKVVSADRDFDELAVEGIERLDPSNIEVWRQVVERGHVS